MIMEKIKKNIYLIWPIFTNKFDFIYQFDFIDFQMTDFKQKIYFSNNIIFPCFQVDTFQRKIDHAFAVLCVEWSKIRFAIAINSHKQNFSQCYFPRTCKWQVFVVYFVFVWGY